MTAETCAACHGTGLRGMEIGSPGVCGICKGAGKAGTLVRVRNYRDLNAKMNGIEIYRQVAYASERWTKWHWVNEAPTAVNVGPRMPPLGASTRERRCEQLIDLTLSRGDMLKTITKGAGHSVRVFSHRAEPTAEYPKSKVIWVNAPNQDAAAQAVAQTLIDLAAQNDASAPAAVAEPTSTSTTVTKRYLVFAGDYYYPQGGWNDFVGVVADPADAPRLLLDSGRGNVDWYHVVDTETMKAGETVEAWKTRKP